MELVDDTDVLTVTHRPVGLTVRTRAAMPDTFLDTESGLGLLAETGARLETSDSFTNLTVRGRTGRIVAPHLTTEAGAYLLTEARNGLLAA